MKCRVMEAAGTGFDKIIQEYEDADESVDQVLKRADKVMYENKLKFKEKYGSYR